MRVRALLLTLALAVGASLVPDAMLHGSAIAHAQSEPDAAESRSAAFRAVEGAVVEDVPGGPLLIGAYGAIFALVLGYVIYLGRMHAGLRQDLERLTKIVEGQRER